jgi:hypothetical protein
MNKHRIKSIGSVLAGIICIVILSVATDAFLVTIGVFPPPDQVYRSWMLGLALLYRTAFNVFGGWITAATAPVLPLRHAIILGCIGIIMASIGAMANWGKSDNWYPLALVLTSLPGTWLGGRMYKKPGQ